MEPISQTPLKRLLLVHELAFIFLVIVTGVIGGVWTYFWQHASQEALRLNNQTYTAQNIRSDLFRQIKEVTVARLMDNPDAIALYADYSRKIDRAFNELRQNTQGRGEDVLVQEMQTAYRIIQKDMNTLFTDPYTMSKVVRVRLLDPRYEQAVVGGFEQSFSRFTGVLIERHTAIRDEMHERTRIAWFIMPVPVLLAIGLLFLSRRSIQRSVVNPVNQLMKGAQRISQGDLTNRIEPQGVEEMAQLSIAINQMATDLARIQEALIDTEKQAALGSLVPVVAHNIRNPLATIRASAQLLDDADQEERQEVQSAVIETVDRLERWVSSLVSYLHPLKPHQVRCQLSEVVDASLTLLQHRIEDKDILLNRVYAPGLAEVLVDTALMEQVVYNLLSNAIDASPPAAELRVIIDTDAEAQRLVIEDEGNGLPFEPKPTSLEPGPSTKRFGTGLGIPVAFKICKAHGWELVFENRQEGGARVIIFIPHEIEQQG